MAHALEPLHAGIVFVGGAIVNRYNTTPAATPEPRSTDSDPTVRAAPNHLLG